MYDSVTNIAQEDTHAQPSRRNMVTVLTVSADILYDGVQAAGEIQFSSAGWLAGMARKISAISSSIETQQRRWRNSGLEPYLQYGL